MKKRIALAMAAVALTGTAGVASAGAKAPLCNQVSDPTGDASIFTPQAGMDIVTADLASDAKSIQAVIRLAAAPSSTNVEGGQSTRYYFEFLAPGSDNPQYFQASLAFGTGATTFRTGEITPSPSGGSLFTADPADPAVTGSITGSVITITAPVASFSRVKLTKGSKISSLKVEVFALIGVLLEPADDAAGAKAYAAGTPTCVAIAK